MESTTQEGAHGMTRLLKIFGRYDVEVTIERRAARAAQYEAARARVA